MSDPNCPRVVCYYQSTSNLDPILQPGTYVNVLIVSSLHFGTTKSDGSPYIHLNNEDPDAKEFDTLWSQTKTAHEQGIKVMLMLGGAGGAYEVLFGNFKEYYGLLKNTIQKRPWITGIDLDIEEPVQLDQVQKLIQCIYEDFGPTFTITMAPVAGALQSDGSGPYGLNYKDIMSTEGERISWFNVQFYCDSFNEESYKSIINNGYPASKIVMGMWAKEMPSSAADTVNSLANVYSDFAGVDLWRYDDIQDPNDWATSMWTAMRPQLGITGDN